ncbi:MAG: ribokinase [Solirubrobacterales bacterium]|nr:ribokinase [Solirubrobacterales bacterium]
MSAERPFDVVVVGSMNADLVVRVDRRPAAGETVLGGELAVHPGGKGANQAVAAARLGARVLMIGAVGRDGYGELLLDSLAATGVEAAGVARADVATGVALIVVDPAGENSIVVAPGANATVSAEVIAAHRGELARAAVCVLQCELPPAAVEAAAREAAAQGTRVVLNLAPPLALSTDVLAVCDPLVLNEHEAAEVLGTGVDDAATTELLARGPRSVVLTLGSRGAIVDEGTGPVTVAAPRVRVADTTGAGDAFTGALAYRLACGDALVDAARLAARVGALTVTRDGAQSSFPDGTELSAAPAPG